MCFPQGCAQAGDQGQEECRRQPCGKPVARQEFSRSVPPTGGTCLDGLAPQIVLQLLRERIDRRIATLRPLGQRFQHDGIEISTQHPGQLAWRRAAKLCSLRAHHPARSDRFQIEDRVLESPQRVSLQPIRACACEQLIQHNPK